MRSMSWGCLLVCSHILQETLLIRQRAGAPPDSEPDLVLRTLLTEHEVRGKIDHLSDSPITLQ